MNRWQSILLKLITPPVWLMILLTVVSTFGLIAVFLQGWDKHPIGIAVYVVAFYTLTVVCFKCWVVLPKVVQSLKQKAHGNQYSHRYLTDVVFKTHVSLYMSLTVNLLYVGTNLLSALIYRSAWFAVFAGYYTILAVMRFLLVRFVNRIGIGKDKVLEFRRSRLCGIILMLVNLTLSGAVLMIIFQNKGFQYNGILIYVMAMFTFYVTAHAIKDIVKYRKYQSPIMSTAKIINLSAALVSMLSLETAMFSQFGQDSSPEMQRLMIMLTGAGVSIVVLTMSVYMIVNSVVKIKKIKTETDE